METLHAGICDLARNAARMGTAHLVVVDERAASKGMPGQRLVPKGLPVPSELQTRIAADVVKEYPSVIFVATVGPNVFSVLQDTG